VHRLHKESINNAWERKVAWFVQLTVCTYSRILKMKLFKKRQVKKAAKLTGIILLVFAVLVTGLHLFVVYRARQILTYIVLEGSDGQYTIKSKKVKFRYNPLSINASGLQVFPVDSLNAKTFYTVTADSVFIEVTKLWPFITSKNFSLGSVHIMHPLVKVYDNDTSANTKKPLNVAVHDMQDALVTSLSAFNVEQCIIEDAGIAYQQNRNGKRPFSVNHIFLDIDSLHAFRQYVKSDTVVKFTANIKLFIDRPVIQLPDTSADVYIQNLLVDTKRNVFSVNRFNLHERNNNGTVDSISLSNVHFRNLNWNRWLSGGVVEIDSLKAFDGDIFFDLSDKEIFTIKDKNRQKKPRHIAVPLELHAVEINKIAYGLRTGSPSGPLTVQLNGDSLGINDLSLQDDPVLPLHVGNLAFSVTRYVNSYDDNSSNSNFEKLIIDHNNLELRNYYRSLNNSRFGYGSSITIPSLKVLNFSLDDLLKYKLSADKLILEKPSLVIDIQQSKKKQDADSTVANITKSLQPSLDIKQLSIRDAAIILLTKKTASGKVTIDKLNTEMDARQLLASKSVMDILGSATALSTSGFHVTGANVDLDVSKAALNSDKNGIYFERIKGSIGTQVNLDLRGVGILDKSERFDVTKLQEITLDDLNVTGGKITVQANTTKGKTGNTKTPAFDIDHVHTGPFTFELYKGDKKITVEDIQLDGSRVIFRDGITTWNSISANSGHASLASPNAIVNASELDIKQPGLLNIHGLNYVPLKSSSITKLAIPELSIQTIVMSTSIEDLTAEKVIATKPSITINQEKGMHLATSLPDFYIRQLVIDQPVIGFNYSDGDKHNRLLTDSGTIVVNDFRSSRLNNVLTAQSLRMKLLSPTFFAGDIKHNPGQLMATANTISFSPGIGSFDAMIDSMAIYDLPLHVEGKNPIDINSASAGIAGYKISSADTINLPYLFKHANWWAGAASIKQQSQQNIFSIYGPHAAATASIISFDSLSLVPVLDRDSFWLATPVEKDYNTLKLGYTELHDWAITGTKGEKKLTASFLQADHVNFLTEKDKTHGPDTVSYRPLLANSFKKIPFLFAVDTMHITNSYVRHNVWPEKSKKEATIFFTGINGDLYNVRNTDYHSDDSLRFVMHGKLMGQGDMLVGFHQSYADTLQEFKMRARMGAMDLSALNSLLVPMVSVKVDRGIVDSMLLIVSANDYTAYGSMDLRYHNLRLSLLKNGEKQYFLSKFLNWILNGVVRSKDNSTRKALYQERLRSKSIYNYWGKIAINGLLTNLGFKRDKKQVRKYNKAVKQKSVPVVINERM
jgi:hypothetical protein